MTSTSSSLPRSTPSAQGVDAAGVDRLIDAISQTDTEMHSLMVVRHGHVIAEGWWAPFAPDLKHLVYSLSKTFTSAAAGLAIAEGRFGLDDVMVDHFPELVPDDLDEKYRRYLVRHALTMASGHESEALDRAAAAGEIDPDIDHALLLDALFGALFFRVLVGHAAADRAFTDALFDQLVPAARSRPGPRVRML